MTPFLISCLTQVTIVSVATTLLYFLASRRRPSVRAAIIGAAMFAIAAVTAMSLCPLPSWWSLLPDVASAAEAGPSLKGDTIPEENALPGTPPHNAAERPRQDAVEGRVPLLSQWLHLLRQSVSVSTSEKSSALGLWPSILLLAIAIGACALLSRFAIGLRAIRGLCRQSEPIEDVRVTELLTRVQQLARCPRSVPVHQHPQLAAAATVGWLRPMIILPADWEDWSADELQAVLAHEVAHVCRRDYFMRLTAYVIAALHFYHPLIRWLTRRLVLEQELASDTLAATVAGGQRRYLRALSSIALRQDDRPNVWPGSIALPVSSRFLMRRIEMLRAKDGSVLDSATKTKMIQGVSVAALVLFSVGATAIRCVAEKPDKADQPRIATRIVERTDKKDSMVTPARQQPGHSPDKELFQRKPFDPSMIARKGSAVFVVRPAELFRRSDLKPMKDAYNEGLTKGMKALAADEELRLKVEQIELIAADFVATFDKKGTEEHPHRMMFGANRVMVRTTQPYDWKRLLLSLFPDTVAKEHRQQEYLALPVIPWLGPANVYVCVMDDRTLLFGCGEKVVKGMIAAHVDATPRYDWGDQWTAVDGGLMTIAFDNCEHRWLQIREIDDDLWKPFVGPLLDEAQFICIGADWSNSTNRLVVQGRAISQTPEQSDQVKQTVENLLVMARTAIESDASLDKQRKLILGHVLSFLQSASLQAGTTADGHSVIDGRIETKFSFDQLEKLLETDEASELAGS